MAANAKSHRLTEVYRERLVQIADRVEAQARELWPRIEDLDTTTWADQMAAVVSRAQTEGVRLSAGYLTAYIASETGRRVRTRPIDSKPYVGVARDGRELRTALKSPIIGTLAALKSKDIDKALTVGLIRGVRMAKFEVMQTARDALTAAIKDDERVDDFERSVAGTCAACMALSGETGPHFEVHPGCQCLPQPVVSGVSNNFPLAAGATLFAALTPTQKVAAVGAEAAELIDSGAADLKDFVSHSKQSEQPDFITQKPAQDVAT